MGQPGFLGAENFDQSKKQPSAGSQTLPSHHHLLKWES